MADYKIPVILGDTKVRDYQYWKTADSTSNVNPNINTLMAYCYRVKKWHLAGTLSMTSLYGVTLSIDVFIFLQGQTVDNPTPFTLIDERGILGPAVVQSGGSVIPDPTHYKNLRNYGLYYSGPATGTITPGGLLSQSFVLNFNIFSNSDLNLWSSSTPDIVYPNMHVSAQIVAYDALGHQYSWGWEITPPGTASGNFTIAAPAGGSLFTAPLYALSSEGAPTSCSSSLTFTPVSYFPFNNSTGSPVYDASSGVQLTDPFS